MSLDMTYSSSLERVCYVHCNFCNTILAVSVPCNSMMTIVTVRCGHCGNLLSVNIGPSIQSLPLQDLQRQDQSSIEDGSRGYGSSSSSTNSYHRFSPIPTDPDLPRSPPIRPPEKRQRVPSAYNRFIKEEIQRIKASNPDISHREAFSTAAKNWAHFPHIHFGLKLDGNKQTNKLDHAVAGEAPQKSIGLY
ncbi:Protein YABBY 6 [Capsicum annuum]|uniref:putative axial regulator YABBY 2 isoform X2 n=1 Tax=Capsicum annuum TaxID=4072 RepID=UPI0007BF46D1|nr:putative axial regulator YABBY 2 isoform X2 [Capsicum annuum]KAF3659735.1 Protein YABBY 6 [Capsicum annuum]KAF3662299.1 Protein YABBY 6 [Capsicum annuum]